MNRYDKIEQGGTATGLAARGPFARMGEAFRRAFLPESEEDLRVAHAQLSAARKAMAPTSFILPITATLIAIANIGWVPAVNLIVWPAVITVLCALSELKYRAFLKTNDRSPEAIRYRAKMATIIAAVLMVAWCSMVFVLWAPGVLGNQLLLIFILCASLSGWVSSGAVYLPMIYVSLPVYLVAMTGAPILYGGRMGTILGWLDFGFWLMMAAQAFANYETSRKKIKLEWERACLIEDLKRAKEISDQARDRAEAASRAKSTFLANMSHELRTPLNAILGFSEIIKTRAFGDSIEQYAEYGSYIHGSGHHLLTLINDILDLAKIEAGRMELRDDEVDLSHVIADAIAMMTVKAQQAGVNLIADIAKDLPRLRADERAIRQIVVNLLANAVKFTPRGGEITGFARSEADGRIAFGVRDTGIGIGPEDHRRVFESFGQGRHDAIQADKSTGLGLPIVKGLAEAHGGSVTLESAPNQGTRITIYLPPGRRCDPPAKLRAIG